MSQNESGLNCAMVSSSTNRAESSSNLNVEVLLQKVKQSFVRQPHPYQITCWRHVVGGKDLIVIAGTGAGKSAVFQALPLLKDGGIVLIVSPLKALMHNQVH